LLIIAEVRLYYFTLKKFNGAKAAWMPPVELRHQGCAVSSTNAFGYFGQNQSNSPKVYPEN